MSCTNSTQWKVFSVKENGDLGMLCSFLDYRSAANLARKHSSCNHNLSLIRFQDKGILVYWKEATIKEAGQFVYLSEDSGEEILKSSLYKYMRELMFDNDVCE